MNDELVLQRNAWLLLASAFNDLPNESLVQRARAVESKPRLTADEPPAVVSLADLSNDEALAALGRDRARLLRHVDSSCINPPYESLYVSRSENSVLSELHSFFSETGFAPTGAYKEPADYIGMELSFLAECCAQELEARAKGDSDESERLTAVRERFITEHASVWIPSYACNMHDAAQTGLYREIARLLSEIFPER